MIFSRVKLQNNQIYFGLKENTLSYRKKVKACLEEKLRILLKSYILKKNKK